MDVGKYLMDRSVRKGECWVWQQSCVRGDIPRMHLGPRNITVRRWAWEQTTGKQVKPKRRVIATCGTAKCVNPDHLEMVTASVMSKIAVDEGRWHTTERAQGHLRSARARSPLTAEDVAVIRQRRAAGEVLRTIAADYGVCKTTVSAIARGINWRDDTPVSSVFTWRPL